MWVMASIFLRILMSILVSLLLAGRNHRVLLTEQSVSCLLYAFHCLPHFHEINLFLWRFYVPGSPGASSPCSLLPHGPSHFFSLLFFTPSKHGPAEHPPYCCRVPRIAKHVLAPPLSLNWLTPSVNAHSLSTVCLVPLSSLIEHTFPVLPHSDIIDIMTEAWSNFVTVTY